MIIGCSASQNLSFSVRLREVLDQSSETGRFVFGGSASHLHDPRVHEVGADLFGIYEEEAEAKKQVAPATNRLVRSTSMISPEAVPWWQRKTL